MGEIRRSHAAKAAARVRPGWAAPAVAMLLAFVAFSAMADDPALEARVLQVTSELRCLVCQNQTIAESNADLAVDLRAQVREMLRRGDDEARITAYMTARYGDFVLYRPPLKRSTWLLWSGPVLMLLCGLVAIARMLATRRVAADDEPDPSFDPSTVPLVPRRR